MEVDKLVLDHKNEIETLVNERKVSKDDQLKMELEVGTLR